MKGAMIDPIAEAKCFMTLDELLQALIEDDTETRFGEKNDDEPRTEAEAAHLARYTLLHCGFDELRPVVFRHPMAELTFAEHDTSDELVTVAIVGALKTEVQHPWRHYVVTA